jgi:hypothetical protein
MRFVIPALALSVACGLNPSALTGNLPTTPTMPKVPDNVPKVPGSEVHLPDLADAALEPLVAEPSPPASRDKDGKLHGPGGPISAGARECGPAQNHCLRGNAWFANGVDSTRHSRYGNAPVFELEGHWYSYGAIPAEGATVYRTKPATPANIKNGREVYLFTEPPTDKATVATSHVGGALPQSEKEALLGGRWARVVPYTVDAAKGTFTAGGLTYRIDAARVAFDPRGAE